MRNQYLLLWSEAKEVDGDIVKPPSYQLFEAGIQRDGWFTNDDLVAQTKGIIPLAKILHPYCDILFAFDNSMTHHKQSPNGLQVSDHWPLKDNGKNAPLMRDTVLLLSIAIMKLCPKPWLLRQAAQREFEGYWLNEDCGETEWTLIAMHVKKISQWPIDKHSMRIHLTPITRFWLISLRGCLRWLLDNLLPKVPLRV